MVVDEQAPPLPQTPQSTRLWCYLVSLRGQLYAVPDEPGAVLMPHIGRLPAITPLPLGLVRPYVLGLVNVSQRGELLVDLAAFLGLAGDPPPAEQRCILLLGESAAEAVDEATGDEPYRLAFAVDAGHELAELDSAGPGPATAGFARELVQTRRGQATLLNMHAICATIVGELGAERPWNGPAPLRA